MCLTGGNTHIYYYMFGVSFSQGSYRGCKQAAGGLMKCFYGLISG